MANSPDIQSHGGCFACSPRNSYGLKLSFVDTPTALLCRVILDAKFQSYDGIVHGGILASIADATMVNLVHREFGGQPLTCALEMRYRHSIRIGEEVVAEASVICAKHQMVWAQCLISVTNRICVEARAAFKINPH